MEAIVNTVKELKKLTLVKFIIETGLLTSEEIKKVSELVLKSGADFVKTCSGWGPRGASLEDVRLIREAIGDKIKIKVAGGIDTLKEAIDFINAGVDRIGTSKAVEILKEWK
jgi:deoxyribose-phosphate aldolase